MVVGAEILRVDDLALPQPVAGSDDIDMLRPDAKRCAIEFYGKGAEGGSMNATYHPWGGGGRMWQVGVSESD